MNFVKIGELFKKHILDCNFNKERIEFTDPMDKDLDMNYVYEQMQLGNIKDISIIDTTCKLYEDSKK